MPGTVSLWPKDLLEQVNVGVGTPAVILKEQAALLGEQTGKLVQGRVTTRGIEGSIITDFDLVVPSLDYYSYLLLRTQHGPYPYPVKVAAQKIPPALALALAGQGGEDEVAKDEKAFKELLQRIFSSEQTKKILRALLEQAQMATRGKEGGEEREAVFGSFESPIQ
ncbi:MAG: hypothetical protein ABSE73_18995 [Planctomycetota bacterium]